ncbi:mediator complex subunit [Coemansia aciculifera]|uniref:Mediator of RNA polymerase II transcription subunit 14 n=1 Tax=Coemansia aciculifera TaxID=417176 RepID=A0A9W8II46_9FUNG|nr:mediator complex subunit [Coemansia aciculifera]
MWPTVQRVPSQVTSTPGNTEQQVFSSRANSMDINGDSESQQQPQLSQATLQLQRNGDNDSGSDDEGRGSSTSADELPQINVQMVRLSEILERLVTFAYTELVTLVDTLPSRGESERRNELLKYTEHISSLLTKLLVLVRWAKNARHIQKCQNSIAYLDSQNRYFEYSVDGIYAAFLSMPNVRMRNYDVGNAVDILTTGSYQRLPLAISRNVSKPRLNKRQVGKTLLAIDDIIRGRMLSGEPVPVAMRQYAIGGGRIVFRVEGEFEAMLTLLQHGKDIPWHVVGVKVLAGDDQQQTSDDQQQTSTSTNTNTWALVERAQQILVEASTTENEDEAVPQLAQLYDFLHRQSLAVLLETVARQATTLRRTRWEGALQAEMTGDRSALVLRYWASGRAAAGLSGGGNSIELRVVGQPVPRPIHAAAEAGAQAAAVVGDGEFARMERGRRDLIPKAGLRVAWTAHAGLAASQAWQRTAAGLSELADADMRLCLDSSAVDVERLLRQATWQHACAILDGLHAAVAASPALGPGAAQLAFVAASGAEVAAEDAARLAATPRLRAWFRLGEGAVDVTVDGVSGRLAVRAAAGSAALGETLVAQLADRANRSPWRIAELLVDLRAALALADLDALAERALGLRRQEHSAGGFPLRVAQADADMLARDVGGTAAHAGQRLRFYRVEGTEGEGEWFVMAAMTDRLRFRLVCLAGSGLVRDVTQVEALQVDRLFASVARRLSGEPSSCARAEAMLAGRTGIGLDYVNALASAVRARLAVRAVQAQLSARRISYAFRLPKFSTSPHGPRAAVSQELSVVGIDRMGLYELDEQVPVLYVPVAALMRAAPVNWRVAQRAVLPDEARRMVSLRVASDELDPTPLSDMRHIVPCHVVASMPVALDALPRPVAQAHADAVYFGKHAAPEDGGYHLRDSSHVDVDCGGYSKVVRVYRRVDHALQRLIRDWAELHLMAHVARHLFAWEQRALRRVLASTVAYYPVSPGPYTKAATNMEMAPPCSAEIVVQCLGSCFLSISCCVPSEQQQQQQQQQLAYHLTLADVDAKSGQTVRIASTWPCSLATTNIDPGLSRWLRTLQARLNLTGNPLAVLSIIVQMMPISHILRSIEEVSTVRCSQPPPVAPPLAPPVPSSNMSDQALLAIHKIVSLSNDVAHAFESVRELHVMHMYTAADNMRLVFNSRYVVDLRLVSSDLFHITDAVGATRPRRGRNSPTKSASTGGAPEPLVTPATEPIPLFADWLDAMARGMRFDWEKLEMCVSAILHDTNYLEEEPGSGRRDKVRLFQRNLHRLRPGASKIEQYLYRFREMNNKQNSARAPTFVVLPPAAVLCTRLHLVPVLRSLMHWLVQSVHVRDLLESAIARTQEAVEQHQPTVAVAAAAVGGVGVRGRTDSLFCVKEKLVYTEEIAPSDAAAASAGGTQPAGGRQVMIVGFTGARDSVRCEFLMQAGVTTTTDESTAPKDPVEPVDGGMALLSDLYSVPSTLMRVDLDVRIVPLNRPPNGITDAAAAHLMRMFKSQTTDIRQRAGVLVRILALPPQLVMDIIDIARKLDGKAVTCALADGMEHLVRIDALNMKVLFAMRFFFSGEWETVVIEYALVSGTAQVVDDKTGVWSERVAAAVAALDAQTAFTRDMGKSGKSRWFDIISKLSEGQTATL